MDPKRDFPVICNMLAKLMQDLVKSMTSNKSILEIHPSIPYKWIFVEVLIIPVEQLLNYASPGRSLLPCYPDTPVPWDTEFPVFILILAKPAFVNAMVIAL
jgi:hypothetical protein